MLKHLLGCPASASIEFRKKLTIITRATLSVALYARSKLSISCKGYNVNIQTAVAAILVFVEGPKSIASDVLVVLRPYQNVN